MTLKELSAILGVNAVLILFFVFADYSMGNVFNEYPNNLYYIHWGFFSINYNLAGSFVNGNWVAVGGLGTIDNFLFWLFFASTAINLFFIIRLLRNKESNRKPT